MAADKQALRQQIIAQLEQCEAIAYAAGHHFAEHGKHAPSRMMQQADADAKLVRIIEEYAASGVRVTLTDDQVKARAAAAGLRWIDPIPEEDGSEGYPGGFDMSSLDEIRALIDGVNPSCGGER